MNAQSEQVDQLDEVDAHDDDADFAPKPRAGLGRLTAGLLIGIALVAAFGGGAYVQKHHGGTATTAAAPGGGRFAAGGAGGGAGEGFPGGFGSASGDTTTTGSTTAGSTAADAPAVIGTVVKVSGRTVTVKNLGGKTIKVTVPKGVTVTKSQQLTLADLAKGSSVTVTGTTGADGTVTATGVTAR